VFGLLEGGAVNDETHEVVAVWCRSLNLGSKWIEHAAFDAALLPEAALHHDSSHYENSTVENAILTLGATTFCGKLASPKRAFKKRAEAEFDRQRKVDEAAGGVAASDRIDPKHAEWLVRFQNEPTTKLTTPLPRAPGRTAGRDAGDPRDG